MQSTNQVQQGLLASNTSQKTSNPWLIFLRAAFYLVIGTSISMALGDPLIKSVIEFAQAANVSSFWVSYLAIPLALNYGSALLSITSATQKTKKSISLTLSSVHMLLSSLHNINNIPDNIIFGP